MVSFRGASRSTLRTHGHLQQSFSNFLSPLQDVERGINHNESGGRPSRRPSPHSTFPLPRGRPELWRHVFTVFISRDQDGSGGHTTGVIERLLQCPRGGQAWKRLDVFGYGISVRLVPFITAITALVQNKGNRRII